MPECAAGYVLHTAVGSSARGGGIFDPHSEMPPHVSPKSDLNERTKKILAQIGSFLLAGVLLYFALQGVNFSDVGEALREANYWWLIPLVAVTLFSHVLRAWRWQILLEALPAEVHQTRPQRISMRNSFFSLMIGYMINYAAPRAGEIARSVNMAKQERLRFSGVLGTVAVERILDVVVLGLAFLSVFALIFDRFSILKELFIRPITTEFARIPVLWLIGTAAVMVVIIVSVIVVGIRARRSGESNWYNKLVTALLAFKGGMMTLIRTRRRMVLLVSTLGMWFCYALMAYLPLVILGMTDGFGLALSDAWVIMVLGAVGIAIPSPGGTGSYHYLTIEALVHIFDVSRAPAASYAILSHGGQLVLYVFVGILCLILQGTSFSSLKSSSIEEQAA